MDNSLAAAQRAIGESSNLAQICLTYTYNYPDQKYINYVCILSVLAQVAIDNAKRRFDIDLNNEIARIKADMNVAEHGHPAFWGVVKKGFNKDKINYSLKCPMNYIFDIETPVYRSDETTLPMSKFFVKYPQELNARRCMKVEELIEKYSLNLYEYNSDEQDDDDDDEYFVLREDFNQLVEDIRGIYISRNYMGLMSWLIDRALMITPQQISNKNRTNTKLNKNRSLLLKVLYDVNSDSFLKCFIGNLS